MGVRPEPCLQADRRRIDAVLGQLVERGAVSISCGRIVRTHLRPVRWNLVAALR
jgi:hypothetical protein